MGGRDSDHPVLDFRLFNFPHFRVPLLDDQHLILDRDLVLNRNLKSFDL